MSNREESDVCTGRGDCGEESSHNVRDSETVWLTASRVISDEDGKPDKPFPAFEKVTSHRANRETELEQPGSLPASVVTLVQTPASVAPVMWHMKLNAEARTSVQ